jgi:hypothetical protein
MQRAYRAAAAVDAGAIAQTVQGGDAIRTRVAAAREQAVKAALEEQQGGRS